MSLLASLLILYIRSFAVIQERTVTVCLLLFIPIRYLSILLSTAIAVGFYFFLLGFRLLARKHLLLTIPTSKIRGAATGLVEVSGVAAGPCTTFAPITGEPCFLYHTTAWQQRDGPKNDWEKVADETLHLPFFIGDSTGQLLIEALGADLDLHPRFRREYASLLDMDHVPQSVNVFLARHGIALDGNLCIEERLIKADDALFVAGTLAENPEVHARPSSPRSDASADRRNRVRNTVRNIVTDNDRRNPARNRSSEPLPAPEVIRLASAAAASSTREMSQQAKIAAALTRAGIAGPQAWSDAVLSHQTVAVEAAAPPVTISSRPRSDFYLSEMRLHQARPDEAYPNEDRPNEDRPNEDRPNEDQSESSGFNLIPPVVLMKGAADPTFVISFRSQKEIVSATTWKAAVMVCGGTTVMLLGFYMLWTQMARL